MQLQESLGSGICPGQILWKVTWSWQEEPGPCAARPPFSRWAGRQSLHIRTSVQRPGASGASSPAEEWPGASYELGFQGTLCVLDTDGVAG